MLKPTIEDYSSFRDVIKTLANKWEVEKEIMHYVDLLVEEVNRKIFDMGTGKKEKKSGVREFISIFKNRYLQYASFEYTYPLTEVDAKMIRDLIAKLEQDHMSCDEFLGWFFDVFLETDKNKKQNSAPTLKGLCSNWIFDSFRLSKKLVIKARKESAQLNKDAQSILQKARELIRETGDVEIKKKLEAHSKDELDFEELKQYILNYKKPEKIESKEGN